MIMKITTFNRVYIFLDIEKVQKGSRFRFQIIQHCYTLEYGKKQQLNEFIMDKLLKVADKQAYNQTSSQNFEFDENLFQQFMSKNPLWDYHCMAQEEYLQKTKSEKEQLLSTYYIHMKKGEKH